MLNQPHLQNTPRQLSQAEISDLLIASGATSAGATPDTIDHEAYFSCDSSTPVSALSVKRSHFSWEFWGIRCTSLNHEGHPPPTHAKDLIDHVSRHALSCARDLPCILSVVTENPEFYRNHDFIECFRYGQNEERSFMLKSLNAPMRIELHDHPFISQSTRTKSVPFSIKGLEESQLESSAKIAAEVWGADTEESFLEESTRYFKQGAYISGAFDSNGDLLGTGIIKECYESPSLWGLTWGIVSKEYQSRGIGSALTEDRIQYARSKTADGVVLVVTSDPRHSLRNGFQEVARYGNSLEKYLLKYEL